MATAGSIVIDLLMKTGAFETNSKRAEKRLREMGKTAKQVGVAIGAAIAASGAALAVGVKNAIDYADAMDNMAQRIGIGVDVLSRLDVAARLSDTSVESLQKGMLALGRAQLDANKGGDEQIALFDAIGVSLAELEKMAPDELLKRIADAFQATADSPQKAAVAMKLFGKAGADLIPLLNGGSEGLAKFERMADELGLTISQETASGAAAFNDQLDILKLGMDGIFRTAAKDLLPTLNELAADFNDPRFREGIGTIITGATTAIVKLVELGAELGNIAKWAGEEFARQTEGAGLQDLQELDAQIASIEERLAKRADRPGQVGLFSATSDELRAQLTMLKERRKQAVELAKFMEEQAAKGGKKPAAPGDGAGPVELSLGIDFEAWEKAAQKRERLAAAAAAGRRAEADATRDQAEADRAAAQAQREAESASADFLRITEELTAELGGPLAQVQLDYVRREDELIALAQLAGLSNEELAASLDLLERARQRDVEATQKQIDAQKELEQALANQGTIAALDDFRFAFEDNLASVLDGTSSIKDAFTDLADSVIAQIARMIAQQWTDQLFGAPGTMGSDSSGGGFMSWLFGAFAGAKASGGDTMAGRSYLVGEQGPELFVPRTAGAILPADRTAEALAGRGKSMTQNITFNVQGHVSRRSADQIRADMYRAGQKAVARRY